MGIAHVPEGRRVFAELSVLQNLKLGAYTRNDKNEMEATLKEIYARFPRLEERKNQMAGTLSGGEQQMLAMGPCTDVSSEADRHGRAVHGVCPRCMSMRSSISSARSMQTA